MPSGEFYAITMGSQHRSFILKLFFYSGSNIHSQVPALNHTEPAEKETNFSSTQKEKPQELPQSTKRGCCACSLGTCLSCLGFPMEQTARHVGSTPGSSWRAGDLPAPQSLWPPGLCRACWAPTAPNGAFTSQKHRLQALRKPLHAAGSVSHPGSAPRGAVRSNH